ncbi:unnamed protein product, partial [Closterium sp. NIES-54]
SAAHHLLLSPCRTCCCVGRRGGAWRLRGWQEGICSTRPPAPPFSSIPLLRVQQWGGGDLLF